MRDAGRLLEENRQDILWGEYCGFLNYDIKEYMKVQYSFLEEQLRIWSQSGIGRKILKNDTEVTTENFRKMIPLTDYEDYADILLNKEEDKLPAKPEIWIQTTWEGAVRPIKLAPFSRAMLDVFRDNVMGCLLMSTATEIGNSTAKNRDNILYGLAPLPYITGLLPQMLGEITDIGFFPPVEQAVNMSFSMRNKLGFKMAMENGVELFFGLGSVALAVSKTLELQTGGKKPKDLFKLKGLIVAGTDNKYYKDDLEELWGVKPIELFAGTEPSLVGCETPAREGMYFFPNTCMYEFVRYEDTVRSYKDPSFVPETLLMDQVQPGEVYELILSVFHGGAFMRYRCGDVYRCIGLSGDKEQVNIPRFEYVDRVPWIIDIAGFSRFNEAEIDAVMKAAGFEGVEWLATKGIDEANKPYLRIFMENLEGLTCQEALKRVMEAFEAVDEDFVSLKMLLGMKPLEITLVEPGKIKKYIEDNPQTLRVNSMKHP